MLKTMLLALLALSSAQAAVIPHLVGVTAVGPNFQWEYTFGQSGDQNFRHYAGTDDFTSVVNVGGFLSASWVAGTLTLPNVILYTMPFGPGAVPPGVVDTADINIVIQNGGATLFGGGVDSTLGSLMVLSIFGNPAAFDGAFSTQAQKAFDGTTTFNVGYLPVPGSSVPEPSTFALALTGALLLSIGRLRRNVG